MKENIIRRLEKLTEGWGGKFLRDEWERVYRNEWKPPIDGMDEAPFTNYNLAAHFRRKIIAFDPKKIQWPHLIHEMGHVFASKSGPHSAACNEYDFYGWEHAVAKHVRGRMSEWYHHNSDYVVGGESVGIGNMEVGALNRGQRTRIFRDRVEVAIRRGLIKREGKRLIPLAIR